MKSAFVLNAYLRFTRLLEALEGASKLVRLDDTEKKLLDLVAINYYYGKPLLVSQAIYLSKLGSPATLHRRLSNLQKEDYIRYADDIDGRKKYLELTPKSKDYFAGLGRCVIKAAKLD